MPDSQQIKVPSGFAPATAIGFADQNDALTLISSDAPLPVAQVQVAATAPLAGTATASGTVGPFVPAMERPVVLELNGAWVGEVKLLRSTDGGTTRSPVTLVGEPWAVFASNATEQIWVESEQGVELYLDITISSGSIDYRVSQ